MAIRGKFLYKISVIGIRGSYALEIGVYGLFNTSKVNWDYYAMSWYTSNNRIYLSNDIGSSPYDQEFSMDLVSKYGKSFPDIEGAKKYCDEFKIKWESGLNITTAEQRDKKIDDILK